MLARLNAVQAVERLDRVWGPWPTTALGAEYLALQAFADACAGRTPDALLHIERSGELSSQIEADVLRVWADAIVAHRNTESANALVEAFDHAYELGHVDSVITAYRSYTPALYAFAQDDRVVPFLKTILDVGNDHGLAKRVGIRLATPHPAHILTRRETEVLGLIHQGFSNAQIAKALWISESTAKVHVRHVLRKLGVRTRTEAAVHADEYLA